MNEIKNIIAQLTVKEKLSLLVGKNYWETKDIKRLNIRSIFMSDGPHGLRKQDTNEDNFGFHASVKSTCFPTASALACSFDRSLLYKVGSLLSSECQNQNVDILLGPGINIKRHPLCGRNFEYFSEDPHLTGELAVTYIQGLQENGTSACVKHFALNNQEFRRQISNSVIDETTMHEIYLKAFKTVIKKANPDAIMSSYNLINGIYASENKYLLKDILRDELNYQGIVISDWGALNDEINSFINGLNVEMPGLDKSRVKTLYKAYKENKLTCEQIDAAIYPLIFYIYNKDWKFKEIDYQNNYFEAVKVADECSVLIKNLDDFLPLKEAQKVLFIGDFNYNIRYQGAGSSNVNPYLLEQIFEIKHEYSNNITIIKGYDSKTDEIIEKDLRFINENINKFNKIIYLCGLPNSKESEGFDRKTLEIPLCQTKLYEHIYNLNKNIGVILLGGSPFDANFTQSSKAILIKYLSGAGSARSILNTIYGKCNPSGRLAETWPKNIDDIPVKNYPEKSFNCLYTEGQYIGYKHYHNETIKPLFSFGHGISYSKHIYKDFLYNESTKKITFKLKNESNLFGKEVVQIYVEAKNTDYSYLCLKHFEKVNLNPFEEKEIEILIDNNYFTFYDQESKKDINYSGCFTISIRKDADTSYFELELYNQGTKDFIMPTHIYNLKPNMCENNIKGKYNINSTINDLNSCFLGHITNKVINKIANIYIKKHPSMEQVIKESLEFSPLRIFTIGTNGKISYKTTKKIVKFLNGKK